MFGKRKFKRLLVVSDFHSGHVVGLTPPEFEVKAEHPYFKHAANMRTVVWDWFAGRLKELAPFDIALINGDAIDGKGSKSGGTEQIYMDRNIQVDMATAIIEHINAPTVIMSYGTAYHTGQFEDYEDLVAKNVGALKIGGEDTVSINNLLINYRHKIGRSGIPHGRHTALAKEALWNLLWAERGEYSKAQVLIRSHVHYHNFCGGVGWFATTTPALQGYGGKYGTRECTGTVDIGFMYFDIYEDGSYTWEAPILRLPIANPLLI